MKDFGYIREVEIIYKKKRVKDKLAKAQLNSPRVVFELFKELQNETKEKFIIISLDSDSKIICFEVVAIGDINSLAIKPFQVFRTAILVNAAAEIILHNHPSGNVDPSKEDIEFTRELLYFAKRSGLNLIEHIIIGYEKYFSFRENDLLF